jgi:hypothetical protein
MNTFTQPQLDAVMSDPTTMAEFTLATGNDPSVVTSQSGEALLEIIRGATAKEERLKSLERERVNNEEHKRLMDETLAAAQLATKAAEKAREDASREAAEKNRMATELNQHVDLAASVLAANILNEVRSYWFAALGIGILAGAGLSVDIFKDYTHLGHTSRIVILSFVAAFVFYHSLAFVWPDIEPAAVRVWVTRKVAKRRLAQVAQDDLRSRVWGKLPIPPASGPSNG